MYRAVALVLVCLAGAGDGNACSPVTYHNQKSIDESVRSYVEQADWIAIGEVVEVEEVQTLDVWRQYKDYPDAAILAGMRPSRYLYFHAYLARGVRYSFKVDEIVWGKAPETATLWSVDSLNSDHPRYVKGRWDPTIAIGSHVQAPTCTIFPAFERGQSVLLVKRHQLTADDFPGDPHAAEFARMFSEPAFRDLEPTDGNGAWIAAIKAQAESLQKR